MNIPVRRGRLQAIADQLGEELEELVPRVVNERGSVLAAAMELGVTPGAIRYQLKRLGYTAVPASTVAWVKTPEAV